MDSSGTFLEASLILHKNIEIPCFQCENFDKYDDSLGFFAYFCKNNKSNVEYN